MVLQSVGCEKGQPRFVFIFKPKDDVKSYSIGRGNDADIRVTDISVSRAHAKFVYKDRKFFVEDTRSKFGTLILCRDNIIHMDPDI